MAIKKLTYVIVACCILSACSSTLPVKGLIQDSNESFSGTTLEHANGNADLKITSNQGAVCTGNYAYITKHQGKGAFNCDDGRSGPFKFITMGEWGAGHGQLGGDKFTFTFGSLTPEANM